MRTAEGVGVYFRVLGPIEIWDHERQFSAGTLKEQHLLAILLMEAGRAISAQGLAERLWDERLPDKARETLQVYVSRLRGKLRAAGDQEGLITSSPAGGYRLDVPPGQVDARRFEQLLIQARAAAAKPHPEQARALLLQAEGLWRGEPLTGLVGQWAEATRQALSERYRSVLFARIELDLRLGGHSADLISELTALTAVGRIDQNAIGLLMRALNNAGRQDDALATYRRARARLRDELGVEPRMELQALHQQILRGDTATSTSWPVQPGAGAPAPDTLDRDPPYLVGRDEQLHDIRSAVAHDLRTGSHIVIYALDGMPGVGKSALAIRAAHRLRAHCADGVLQLNLRTHHPHQPPLDSREALTQLLDAVATPAAELGRASTLDALAALWRRRSSGRRLLVLLDDVLDADQIGPLLPTAPGSVVLVTSRRRLLGLPGARQHTLPVLPEAAAGTLLARITGRDFAEQPDEVADFAHRCGGLPLAVTVAAAYLRARPTWTISDLVARLDAASRAPEGDTLAGPVHAAFAMSYNALAPPHRTLLRRLAAHPGHEIIVDAAAALAGTDCDTTNLALDILAEHHLIDETDRHRYRLHDLLREFALSRIPHEDDAAETQAAIDRVLEFYLAAATRAEYMLRPYRRLVEAPPVSSAADALPPQTPEEARTWLDAECDNLIAIAGYAFECQRYRYASLLPQLLAQHLDRRGHWRRAVDLLERALNAHAALAGAPLGSETAAQLMTDLAAAHIRTGDLDSAQAHAETALAAWQAQRDIRGQADASLQLGRVHWYARHPAAADAAYENAAVFYDTAGDRRGHAVAQYHRGIVLFELGLITDALAHTAGALQAAQSLSDQALECDALTNLGEMYRLTDRFDEALAYFHQAQILAEHLGDPHNTAVLANNIGAVYAGTGRYDGALASFRTALRLFQALSDYRNEIDTHVHLAAVRTHTGDYREAHNDLQRAAALATQLHDPLRRARIDLATGHLHRAQDHKPDALTAYQAALAHARQAAAPLDQAHALRALGDSLAAQDTSAAKLHRAQARELYRQLGHPDAQSINADDD